MQSKKLGIIIGILLIVSFIFGDLAAFGAKSVNAAEYFPLHSGTIWVYKRTYQENVNFFRVKVADPENGNPKIIVYDSNGNPSVFVYYIENQQGLFKVKEMSNGGVFEYQPLWQVLGANMKVGSAWNWESSIDKRKESSRVIAAEKITVPAGTFDTIVIECKGNYQNGLPYTDKTWYAKGVGNVKDENTIAGEKILSELCEYHLGK